MWSDRDIPRLGSGDPAFWLRSDGVLHQMTQPAMNGPEKPRNPKLSFLVCSRLVRNDLMEFSPLFFSGLLTCVLLGSLDVTTLLYLSLIPVALTFDSFLAICSPRLICLIWLWKCLPWLFNPFAARLRSWSCVVPETPLYDDGFMMAMDVVSTLLRTPHFIGSSLAVISLMTLVRTSLFIQRSPPH